MGDATEVAVPDLSLEFVSKLIGKKVESFTIKPGTAPGDNYMSVLYCLRCVLADSELKNGKKEIVYAISKNYPAHPMRQQFLNKSNIFWNELCVYNTWIPELRKFASKSSDTISKLPFPGFISGEAINFGSGEENKKILEEYAGKVFDPYDIYILMVDMKNSCGFQMADRKIGLEMDELTLVIKEYAKVHALSWAYKVIHDLPDLSVKFPFFKFEMNKEDMTMFVTMMQANFQMAHDALMKVVKPEEEVYLTVINNMKEHLSEIMEAAWGPNENGINLENYLKVKLNKTEEERKVDDVPWKVVIHGDCWINNLLFRYEPETKKALEMVLIDLQMMREACPTSDLAYCLYSSVGPEFRRKHLDEMLKLYADEFMRHCDSFGVEYLPGFSYEALKRRFHSSKIIGAVCGIMVLPILLKDAKDAVDMETLAADADFGEMFSSITAMADGDVRYQERVYGMTKELYEAGVL